jgi:hypothetical protein
MDDCFAGMTINQRIQHRHEVLKQTPDQIAIAENRSLIHICNIINNHYPPNKRNRDHKWLGDPGHDGHVCTSPEETRKWRYEEIRLRRYGLTEARYVDMLEDQDYKCLICAKDITKNPAIDHIPNTDPIKVRGILCYGCNTALGKLQDDPRILLRAIRYIIWNEPVKALDDSIT